MQDGIVLKLNRLNSSRKESTQLMAVTPSPEDVLDAPDMPYQLPGLPPGHEDQDGLKSRSSFCCDTISLSHSKRTPERNHRSTRRRRGPGSAVQVVGGGGCYEGSQEEVRRHGSMREPSLGSSGSKSLASSASAQNVSIVSTSAPPQTLKSHRAQSQPICTAPAATQQQQGNGEGQGGRNYDDMIKFVFTEHGIKVISDKEYVV